MNSPLQIGFGRRDNIGFSATCLWWQVSTLVGNVRCWVLQKIVAYVIRNC